MGNRQGRKLTRKEREEFTKKGICFKCNSKLESIPKSALVCPVCKMVFNKKDY